MSTDLITAARQWFDAGYCVVPTHEDGGKRPFGPWKQYQSQRLAWDDLEQLLRSGHYSGIGVLTGSASGGVEMIEIEGPLDVALKRLAKVSAAATGFGPDIAQLLARCARGCAEQSAGGGLHIFIRVNDGPALGNVKLAHADTKVVAETRGEGGFVVVAPTPGRNGHPEGAAYSLLKGCSPARTVDITSDDRDVIHFLFTSALHTDPVITEPDAQVVTHDATGGLSALDDYRLRTTWAEILEPAGWVHAFNAADGRDHWVRPGKTIREGTSATTIEDGPLYNFSTSVGWPVEVGLSKGQVYAHIHHGGDLSAATKALAAKGYGSAKVDYSLPAWEAELDPDATDAEKVEAARSWVDEHLPIIAWHDLWADETSEEWIVEPILAKRRLIALYSAPKVGKSLLMLEIAASIAAGRPVLGTQASTPIRTLYVDFENDPRGDIRERLQAMGFGPDDLENLCYLSFPNLGKLDTGKGASELMAAVEHYGCEVVVIDTVSRSVEGDENENDTWLAFYRHTGLALKRAEVAMIRLDHAGKDESKGQRGGSAKSGDVDAVWRLSRSTEDIYKLTCEANRFPISEKVLTLKREESPLRHKVDLSAGADLREEIMGWMAAAGVPKDHSMSLKDVKQRLRQAGHTFRNGVIREEVYEQYCSRIGTWNATEMGA
jgi:hypothetical protein